MNQIARIDLDQTQRRLEAGLGLMKKHILRAALIGTALCHSISPASAREEPARPNFLVIVADDLGYSDIGAFGGEISTPNLDALAERGIRLANFYTAPACSPTRAMFLTGQDHHAVGMGTMAEALALTPEVQGQEGYAGYLDPAVETLAERLNGLGYRTMMSGKWHLGYAPEQGPSAQGFEQSFALLQGAADHFGGDQDGRFGRLGGTYRENGQNVSFPVGRYSSDYFTERMMGFLTPAQYDERPFFAYMAYTAPHWPLQAPPELIAQYHGVYDDGPSVLRGQRLARMRELGLLDERILGARLETLEDWDALDPEQRALVSRSMEIYAAMVTSLDANVGRLLDLLRNSGEFDNTIVLFFSDNGAEGTSQEELESALQRIGVPEQTLGSMEADNRNVERIGSPGTYIAYGPSWAQAAMAPFRMYKGFTEDGGVRTPAFISGPGIQGGRINDSLLSVRDVMPTFLDLGGAPNQEEPVASVPGEDRTPRAISWEPILSGNSDAIRDEHDAIAWELFFRRGIRLGNWKAVYRLSEVDMAFGGVPSTEMTWNLYNLEEDPGESSDVSEEYPEVLDRLLSVWMNYAQENNVYVPVSNEGG